MLKENDHANISEALYAIGHIEQNFKFFPEPISPTPPLP